MIAYFNDSQFLSAAWKQLLETQAHQKPVFFVGDREITTREVLDVLEGRSVDSAIVEAISGFFRDTMAEAMRVVRGRFAAGLKPELDTAKKEK